MRVEAIGHEIKLSIGRDKRDVALLFKLVQPDALMELDVFHLNQFASSCAVLHLE